MPTTPPRHPGVHAREHIVDERKLSVADAAKLMKVGRQALSTLLNGNAALTPSMAKRLEAVFALDAAALLAMQADFDAANEGAPTDVVRFVVPLLEHKARDLEQWAHRNINARQRLSVLIRTLVNSTAPSLTESDFPGNDDAEIPGWDGWTIADTATPWVPAGKTGWEMGTNEDPGKKANKDYKKSVEAHKPEQLADITFVFVTPQHWPAKDKWVEERRAERKWKDVRAFDSSNLEQWIAQSIQAQAWLVTELQKPYDGVWSLDDVWREWSHVAQPHLPATLFDSALASARPRFIDWLSKPADKPYVVASDSVEEALAFLSVLMNGEVPELRKARDSAVVFRKPGVLLRIAEGSKDFIAIAASNEVERELARYAGQLHAVVIHPRNAAGLKPQTVLQPLTSEAFRKALEAAEVSADEIAQWARDSGRSLTVLRRRRATIPAIQAPVWASDAQRVSQLIPLVLAGTWNSANKADVTEVLALAGESDESVLERRVGELVILHDPPLWRASTYRGVTSKIDLLYVTQNLVTKQALESFFGVAKRVLSEDDPALDLPEQDRWAAAIYEKNREYSKALRDSIAETLVLLAVHGDDFFKSTGLSCRERVDQFIQELLTPLTVRVLEANSRDLPAYAEAAPQVFLNVLEKDLKTESPETFKLLRPVESMFGNCPRSGLLWALEGLAWSEQTLLPTALILAKLSTVEIKDNWSNKPMACLTSIFRPWMPQTAADLPARIGVLRVIAKRYPEVAWTLSVALLSPSPQIGHYSHKPRWRNDGYGYGEPVRKRAPVFQFHQAVADLILAWHVPYDARKLADLIDVIPSLKEADVQRVWQHIRQWQASDAEKATVREKIRVTHLSHRAARGEQTPERKTRAQEAKQVFEAMQPEDVVARNSWLFREHWVQESAEDVGEETDYRAREERIRSQRGRAVSEVFAAKGTEGVQELARSGKASRHVGLVAGEGALMPEQLQALVVATLGIANEAAMRDLLIGIFQGLDEAGRKRLLDDIAQVVPPEAFCDLLKLAPFRRETWLRVDQLVKEEAQRYWSDIHPWFIQGEELREGVERLLAAGRPLAAFAACEHDLRELDPKLLYEMLSRIARGQHQEPGARKLEAGRIAEAFQCLNDSTEFTMEEKAALEFAYVEALYAGRLGEGHERTFPNLEQYVEAHPEFYVQALVWAYRREDSGEDPQELRPPEGHESNVAGRAYKVLDALSRLPGSDDVESDPLKNLVAWIEQVRTRASELARLGSADRCLGRLLAAEKADANGVWPGTLAREALEYIGTEEVASGATMGEFNSRGVVARGPGGDQERELAARYKAWANELRYSHPFVARSVLDALAESYVRMATREDDDTQLSERVRH